MSWREISYMLYTKFDLGLHQVKAIINRLTNLGYIHRSHEDELWVASGKDGVKTSAQLNADTIRSMAVALEIIEDPEDYRYIFRPEVGADLSFYCNNTSYLVVNSRTDFPNRLLHMQEMFNSANVKAKAAGGEDFAAEVEPHYLFVFPADESQKSVFAMMNKLDLTLPHTIVFLLNRDIYDETVIETYTP